MLVTIYINILTSRFIMRSFFIEQIQHYAAACSSLYNLLS